MLFLKALLIVPCGIETGFRNCGVRPCRLLIVPCGIETISPETKAYYRRLLIVPCGIETHYED